MFGSRQSPEPVPLPTAEVKTPSIEEVHADASSTSAISLEMFHGVIEDLVEANSCFGDVELRATAEIERLTQLRADAIAQRRSNQETIANLQALLGQ